MKKIFLVYLILSAFYFSFLLIPIQSTFATVGGDSYVGELKYNPIDESVYYIRTDGGGRGCPPILNKISLTAKNEETVFSCNDGEKLINEQNSESDPNYSGVNNLIWSKIQDLTSKFKSLVSINLNKNNIELDISFVKDVYFPVNNTPDLPETYEKILDRKLFSVQVFQNKKKIDQFEISGCNLEQPFLFAGFMIPGFEKKIILVSSAKSDCFEGGYITEKIHIINNLEFLNKNEGLGMYKSITLPLIPTESTLVAWGEDSKKVEEAKGINSDKKNENSINMQDDFSQIYLSIISGIIGILIGIIISKYIYPSKE